MGVVDLQVQPGTVMFILATEWFPEPRQHADSDVVVLVQAVYHQEIRGRVWLRGHLCARPEPSCGTAGCFEHQVATSAIRANLAGER